VHEADGTLLGGGATQEAAEAVGEDGRPVAELIRRAIDRYLQERAKELK